MLSASHLCVIYKKMKHLYSLAFLLISVITSTGCTSNTVENIVASSWSDDSEEIAFLEQRYEETYAVSDMTIGNVRYRVGVVDKNGENRKYITEYFKGSSSGLAYNSQQIYYKSSAGYFVVKIGDSGNSKSNGVVFTDEYDYHIFDTTGETVHSLSKTPNEYCEYFSGIHPALQATPSPSGKYIAVFETSSTCDLDIKILDTTDNFSIIDNQSFPGVNSVGAFWIGETQLFVNTCLAVVCKESWVLVRPGVEALLLSNDLISTLCLEDVNISPDINTSGIKIVWEDPSKDIIFDEVNEFNSDTLNWRMISFSRLPDNPDGCVYIE